MKDLKLSKGKSNTVNLTFLTTLITSLFLSTPSHSSPKTIAITQITAHPALDDTRRGIIDGLAQAGYKDGKTVKLTIDLAQGKADISAQIAKKAVGNNADVIVAISTSSAQAAYMAAKSTSIPVVFASVTDPLGAKLVKSLNEPGKNVTGVSNFTPTKPQFELFKKLVPRLQTIGIVYNPGESNSVALVKKSHEAGKQMGIKIVESPAFKTSDVSAASLNLIGKVDAIFIDNDNTALAAFETIVKVGSKHKIPVFVSDTDMVAKGAAAALGPNQYDIGLQTAKIIVRILKGENASNIPVEFPKTKNEVINKAALAKLRTPPCATKTI